MDDLNRIILEVTGRQKVAELTEEIQRHEKELAGLGAYYQKNAHLAHQMEEAQRRVAAKILDLNNELDKTQVAGRRSGQAMLEVGRAVQDFSQGGIGGILNNLEGLGRSFSQLDGISTILKSPAGIAGALTLVSTAAFVAWPHINRFFRTLFSGSNDIPKVVTGIEGLNRALKDNADRAKELEGKGALTNLELAEYNRLTADRIQLTKDLTEAQKNEAAVAGLREKQTRQQVETAKAVAEAIGEDMEAFEKQFRAQAKFSAEYAEIGDLQQRRREAQAKAAAGGAVETAFWTKVADLIAQKIAAEEQKLFGELGKAVRGDEASVRTVARIMARAPGVGGRVAGRLEQALPERRAEARAAQVQTEETLRQNKDRAKFTREMDEDDERRARRKEQADDKAREQGERKAEEVQRKWIAEAGGFAARKLAAGRGTGAIQEIGTGPLQEMRRQIRQATGETPEIIETAERMVAMRRNLNASFNDMLIALIQAVQEGNIGLQQNVGTLRRGVEGLGRLNNQPMRNGGH
jgi:hypothetical protein